MKPGQVLRRAGEAVLHSADQAKNKLRGVTDNIVTHLDDVKRAVDDVDVFDDKPDLADRPHTHRPHTDGGGGDIGGTTKRHGVDRGDGRDDYGHFVGSENRPWVDKEKIGLDQVADDLQVPVVREQVRSSIDGFRQPGASSDQGRFFDGLFKNADGTYTGIEIKSGDAGRTAAQEAFDAAVSPTSPATAILDGERIRIVDVILREVP